MTLRLRQVAIVGDEYVETENALREVFGLDVAYRDPGNRPGREAGVSIFGLKNFVMPIGNQFLELVTPLTPGPTSAGGRYIERRGGPGGYMLLFQVTRSDYEIHRSYLERLGVRVVAGGDISETGSDAIHIHPKDLPGCLVELRWCENEERVDGDWWPVEKDWRDHSKTEVVEAIVGAEVQTPEPLQLAQRWGEVLQQDVLVEGALPSLLTADGPVRFVEPADGRPEGLGGIDVKVHDLDAVLQRADNFGLRLGEDMVEVSGLRFYLK
ncbi:MAG: hypothetical protein QGH80_01340 [Acidimicrobiales bacterium]|jgi:hypothetical protein|nr:hypothetical protein [Acidimicrobiales bacterium]